MNKLFSGAYGVEFQLTGGKTFLPDIPFLKNKRIKHIDLCDNTSLPLTLSGNSVQEMTYAKITIVEANTGKEVIQSLPCAILDPSLNRGERLFINKLIDLQRSYIYLPNETQWCYAVFYFDDPDVWGMVNSNARTSILPLECTLTGKKTFFSDNPMFLNRQIQNIILEFPTLTHSGKEGIASAYSNTKFLTLSRKNKTWLYRVPVYLFQQRNYDFPLRIQNVKIDLQSSYIESLNTDPADLKTFMFNVVVDDSSTGRR